MNLLSDRFVLPCLVCGALQGKVSIYSTSVAGVLMFSAFFYLLFIFYYKSLLLFWENHTTIETDLSPRRNVIYCIYISSEAGYLYWSSWMRVCFDLASAELETNIYKYSLSHNTLLFTLFSPPSIVPIMTFLIPSIIICLDSKWFSISVLDTYVHIFKLQSHLTYKNTNTSLIASSEVTYCQIQHESNPVEYNSPAVKM